MSDHIDEGRDAKGRAWFEYVMATPAKIGVLPPVVEVGSIGFCFADTWSRAGLDIRSRRLITLACIWMAGMEVPIRTHMFAALKSGDISYDEMHEAILHFAVYAGMPKASAIVPYLDAAWKQVMEDGGPSKQSESPP